jgi:hypothetical protein
MMHPALDFPLAPDGTWLLAQLTQTLIFIAALNDLEMRLMRALRRSPPFHLFAARGAYRHRCAIALAPGL